MQAGVDWVLIIFGTQVIKKKRPVRPLFPDYLSVSYDYAQTKHENRQTMEAKDICFCEESFIDRSLLFLEIWRLLLVT